MTIGGIFATFLAIQGILALVGKWLLDVAKTKIETDLQHGVDERVKLLELQLQKEFHAYQTQYDNELKIYQTLWGSLHQVRKLTFYIMHNPKESENEKQLLDNSLKSLEDLIELNRPFYVADIANLFQEFSIHIKGWREFRLPISEKKGLPTADEIRDSIDKMVEFLREIMRKILSKTDEICEAIRERLTHTKM